MIINNTRYKSII